MINIPLNKMLTRLAIYGKVLGNKGDTHTMIQRTNDSMIVMFERGIRAGNELVRELVDEHGCSKYALAKVMQVTTTCVQDWYKATKAPRQENYNRLKAYKNWLKRREIMGFQKFKG